MTVWLHAEFFFKRDDRVQDLYELTLTSTTTQAKKLKRGLQCAESGLADHRFTIVSLNFSSFFQQFSICFSRSVFIKQNDTDLQ